MNKNYKNNLLFLIILTYIIPISIVYYSYSSNKCISNIITNDSCKNIILLFMILMGFFTILYEIERNNNISLFCIITLLLSIYGVIYYNEKNNIHYIFAFILFTSIIIFMYNHCCIEKCNILYISLIIQIILSILTVINIKRNIFNKEIILIINFALFYLYLHLC
jgi:hypothetical protein